MTGLSRRRVAGSSGSRLVLAPQQALLMRERDRFEPRVRAERMKNLPYVLGLVMFIEPAGGALALLGLIAVFAIVTGLMQIVFALELRLLRFA